MKDTIKLGMPGMKMVAHRGVSGLERENTNAAFVAAGNRSYYGVETDIHRTADGQFIVIHDDTTDRVAGISCTVEETDFDTLRELRMKDLDGNPRGDLIFPSLAEYINLCRKYEKESVLELKNHLEPRDIDEVISIIRECGWLEHVIFISFDLPNCLCLREKLPEQRVQYLVAECDEKVLTVLRENALDLDMLYRNCTREIVDACHAMGRVVNVWTVDSLEEARRMAEYGVDFITTNILE